MIWNGGWVKLVIRCYGMEGMVKYIDLCNCIERGVK